MRILTAAFVLACTAMQASANERFTQTGPFTYTAAEIKRIKHRDDEWFTYCETRVVVKNSMLHAVYANKSCELGHYHLEERNE